MPGIVAGLRVGKSFSAIPVPEPPIIRKGASDSFYDKGLEGASHHAVIPNVNTVDDLREIWPRLSIDEKKLFDVIARAYLAAVIDVGWFKPQIHPHQFCRCRWISVDDLGRSLCRTPVVNASAHRNHCLSSMW